MTRQEALDRADACERATAAATERAVMLKARIDRGLKVLHRGGPGYADALSTIEMALAILQGREET